MKEKYITTMDYTPIQLVIPMDLSIIIDISDPVYTFNEVMSHIDLNKFFAAGYCKTGRPPYERTTLLKIVLFAFMDDGYTSLRKIAKLCKTDIRFRYLLGAMPAPSHTTIMDFINNELTDEVDEIFNEINRYIFETEGVDLDHTYIDGTKIAANANKYSWVWKKSCTTMIQKTFEKLSSLINKINEELLYSMKIKIEPREEYAIEYVELILDKFSSAVNLDRSKFVYGSGHHKTKEQKWFEKLEEYHKNLKKYSQRVEICGDHRNSYSKTDPDATFMRVKKDYMKNDQLIPAYNIQFAVCDEYIATVDVNQYASDMDCFIPLMESYKKRYGHYPKYPVADAGYGSFNNYLFCEEHGMEKFMKFPMYEKETKDAKYRDNPFRAVNFPIDDEGYMICPNGKRFHFKKRIPIPNNHYGRMQEEYECEDCEGCPLKEQCHKGKGNRSIKLSRELTSIHEEVLDNLNSVHGALLRMNRSIQAEGAFGEVKWNRDYDRFRRRGLEKVRLEIMLISCGFNLHKYHLKKLARRNDPEQVA